VNLDLGTADRDVAAAIVRHYPGDPHVAFHSPRYVTVLKQVQRYLAPVEKRILDVGPSTLTELLRDQFGLRVDTMGFTPDRRTPRGDHYLYDLNEARWPERWRQDLPRYDVVVMAEVIEHLQASPRLVLGYVTTLLRPGGVVIVQTPNAVRLGARLKLLAGRNPYALIREDISNPDHFREYSLRELGDYAAAAGLAVRDCIYSNYFDIRYAGDPDGRSSSPWVLLAMDLVYQVMPPRLRTGLTVVAQRAG